MDFPTTKDIPIVTPPVRVVVVGCGGVSNAWLTHCNSRPDIEVVALVDLNPESAQKQAEKYKLEVPIFKDLPEALAALKPEAVFDCSIPATHSWVARTAMEAGCHVIGEKPLADTMENARLAVETAARTGKTYAVMQNRRSELAARKFRELVAGGAIGPVHAVYCDFYKYAKFGGFRAEMPHVLLVDMSIHHFDLARYLSGADALDVYCLETNPPWDWGAHGASAHALFNMEGGVVFNYSASWCSEGLETSWNAHWRIIGETGSATWDGDGKITVETVTRDESGQRQHVRTETEIPVDDWPLPHGYVISSFIWSIRNGAKPQTRGEDNIKSLAMVFAAVESVESGQVVKVTI